MATENVSEDNEFKDEDLQFFLSDERFLESVTWYAEDHITLAEAMRYYFYYNKRELPKRFKFDSGAVARLFHCIAKKIIFGAIARPKVEAPTPAAILDGVAFGALAFKYSEMELLAPDVSPLTARRTSYNETDIQSTIKDKKKLACFHAYALGTVTLNDVKEHLFEGKVYPPRRLSQVTYGNMALEITRRIIDGEISLPDHLREQYPEIYQSNG